MITVDGIVKLEHTHVAEQALGKPLPEGAQVHHINHKKTDNRPCNLVICPDAAYHALLHKREKALISMGIIQPLEN
jgi:HNH endonuclease